ncbi:MAG: site-2 protease family protein [bacterium]|nr:site-2 protease family protein [bacterium]
MQGIDIIFYIVILIFSAVIHEVAHGYAAAFQGDPTAKYAGRLTLNPFKHLDPFGSVILPLLMFLGSRAIGGVPFIFAWAKPVPYNPYNLRNQRWGELIIAIAGPLSNIAIALVFGFILRFFGGSLSAPMIYLSQVIIILNLGLAVFNMVPIPPLDGSKVLFAFLPFKYREFRQKYEQYSLILLLFFIFFFSHIVSRIVGYLFYLIIGA